LTPKDKKAASKSRHTAPFIAHDDLRDATSHVCPSPTATMFVGTTDGHYAGELVDTTGGGQVFSALSDQNAFGEQQCSANVLVLR